MRSDKVPATAPRAGLRRRRIVAGLIDLAVLIVALAAAAVPAVCYLLLRTAWGRDDTGLWDAGIALAGWLATVPAWMIWLALRLRQRGATLGQHRLGLAVSTLTRGGGLTHHWRTSLRVIVHPLSLPFWLWVALLAALPGPLWLLFAASLPALAVILGSAASLVFLIGSPQAPAVHDRVAGTRLIDTRLSAAEVIDTRTPAA